MFSHDEKLKEAKLHLTDLRRRLGNREATGRGFDRMFRRVSVAEELVADLQRAIQIHDSIQKAIDAQGALFAAADLTGKH